MSKPVSVIITVNSPGEVSGWLKPFVKALKEAPFDSKVTVFIPPCNFASGSECKVVREMPEVDLVVEPGQVWSFMLFGVAPPGFQSAKFGMVLFLGGDLTWTVLIAKRLGYPVVAYTEGFANWVKNISCFTQPYPQMIEKLRRQGVPAEKLKHVGNLMLDAVRPSITDKEMRQILNLGERPLLLLMPGSRPSHFEYMVPFLLDVVEYAKETLPELEVVLSISPFVDDNKLQQVLTAPASKLWGRSGSYIHAGKYDAPGVSSLNEPGLIQTESGLMVRVYRGRQYDLMAGANIALSLPGTNTMELSFMGVPMVITIPLIYPERIPLEGIPGLIGGIPIVGKAIKRWLIPKMAANVKYTAWPNLLAQDEVIPELRGQISAAEVSQVVVNLIKKPEMRKLISQRLKSLVGEPGAAKRLVAVVEDILNCHYKNDWR